jgi:hypothetical protein
MYFGIATSGQPKLKVKRQKEKSDCERFLIFPLLLLTFALLPRLRRIVCLFFIIINSALQVLLNFHSLSLLMDREPAASLSCRPPSCRPLCFLRFLETPRQFLRRTVLRDVI